MWGAEMVREEDFTTEVMGLFDDNAIIDMDWRKSTQLWRFSKLREYVGKVGPTRPCRQRCTEHRGAVAHHWDTGVGDHFNLPGHDLAHFNFLPFEKIRSTDPFVIEARESYWIEKYRVLEERGMNRRR